MSQQSTNLLNLENPQEYSCHLDYYTIGHSEALVEVWNNSKHEQFYVFFVYVLCFSGRIRWDDATLRLASDEEHHQFVRQMMHVNNKSDEDLTDLSKYGQLYIFEGNGIPVKFLALGFEKRDNRY